MAEGGFVIVAVATNTSSTYPPTYNHLPHDSAKNWTNFLSPNRTYFSDLVELPGVRYTLVALHVFITVLAAIGNGLLIYFILKTRKMRTNVTAYLVLNLAVCDLVTTCIHQPMRLADIIMPFSYKDEGSESNRISKTYCQVMEFVAAFFAGVAFHTIVAISQERHLLVCYPLKARGWLTVSRIKKLVVLLWTVSFVALLPAFVWFTFIAYVPLKNANVTFCMMDIFSDEGYHHGISYFLFLFCLYFILPTIVISVTYWRIFYVLSRGLGIPEIKDQRFIKVMNARKRLAKLMLLIAIVFIILHAPYFVTFFIISQGYDVNENPVFILLVIEFMSSLNSVFNPFIYSANSKAFFQQKMVAFLGGQDTDSQTGTATPRHEVGGKADSVTAEITLTCSTPSRQASTRRKLSTPSKQYQSIVSVNPQGKKGIEV